MKKVRSALLSVLTVALMMLGLSAPVHAEATAPTFEVTKVTCAIAGEAEVTIKQVNPPGSYVIDEVPFAATNPAGGQNFLEYGFYDTANASYIITVDRLPGQTAMYLTAMYQKNGRVGFANCPSSNQQARIVPDTCQANGTMVVRVTGYQNDSFFVGATRIGWADQGTTARWLLPRSRFSHTGVTSMTVRPTPGAPSHAYRGAVGCPTSI